MATKKESLSISIDSNTKKEAVELFGDIGMDMSGACNVFLKRCIAERGIPFPVSLAEYASDSLDFFTEWSGVDLMANETLVKYLEHENVNTRRIRIMDMVSALDAMICVVGQCGGFKDDKNFFENMKFVLPELVAYPKNPIPYSAEKTESLKRVPMKVIIDNRDHEKEYVLSPYTSHLVSQFPYLDDVNFCLQAPVIIKFMDCASQYLDSFAYELDKADDGRGAYYEHWLAVLFDEVHRVQKVLRNNSLSLTQCAMETECFSLQPLVEKTLNSTRKSVFCNKYNAFVLGQAVSNILQHGYQTYTEENRKSLEEDAHKFYEAAVAALKENEFLTYKESFLRDICDCCIEMCASQDANTIFKIIADELNYRMR